MLLYFFQSPFCCHYATSRSFYVLLNNLNPPSHQYILLCWRCPYFMMTTRYLLLSSHCILFPPGFMFSSHSVLNLPLRIFSPNLTPISCSLVLCGYVAQTLLPLQLHPVLTLLVLWGLVALAQGERADPDINMTRWNSNPEKCGVVMERVNIEILYTL